MNIPRPTWSISVVVAGRIVVLLPYTSIVPPREDIIAQLALNEGINEFTDSNAVITDDGRDS